METQKNQMYYEPVPIIGEDKGLARVMEQVEMVANLDTSVLLMGETGVGKGLIAREIHNLSVRRNNPFVNVNCGAIPETLVDSELFGHEKGSFTGALTKKQGRFEQADKGTIFLDEIGELPLPVQVRLLHVLQTREIERVGGTGTLSLNIRLVSATHRNLDAMVADGTFREDLWFRLNVFPIQIPPLRRRKSDIPELARYFVRKKAGRLGLGRIPEINRKEIEHLQDYHWPGNVRELENIIERALICSRSGRLNFAGLIPGKGLTLSDTGLADLQGTFLSLDQINRIHIRKALVSAKGKINGPGGAAQLLNIHPNTLRKRMDRLGIPYGRNLARPRGLESSPG